MTFLGIFNVFSIFVIFSRLILFDGKTIGEEKLVRSLSWVRSSLFSKSSESLKSHNNERGKEDRISRFIDSFWLNFKSLWHFKVFLYTFQLIWYFLLMEKCLVKKNKSNPCFQSKNHCFSSQAKVSRLQLGLTIVYISYFVCFFKLQILFGTPPKNCCYSPSTLILFEDLRPFGSYLEFV